MILYAVGAVASVFVRFGFVYVVNCFMYVIERIVNDIRVVCDVCRFIVRVGVEWIFYFYIDIDGRIGSVVWVDVVDISTRNDITVASCTARDHSASRILDGYLWDSGVVRSDRVIAVNVSDVLFVNNSR